MARAKYKNRRVTFEGETYASRKELKRFQELELMQAAGRITGLRKQVKFVLIPAQYEPDWVDYSKSTQGRKHKGKCIEHEAAYIADFVYLKDGEMVVEDAKGFRTKDYILKRKMMLYFHGIKIQEV